MKKLFIDIPAMLDAKVSVDNIKCEYFYHRNNPGTLSLLEIAEFSTYCRQCKIAFCIEACPKEALDHLDSGIIKRHNMRCVGCKSCILACPFGTIFPEVINYISGKCDYCLEKVRQDQNYQPECVKTSPEGIIEMVNIEQEDPKNNIFFCGEHVAIKTHSWRHKEGKE